MKAIVGSTANYQKEKTDERQSRTTLCCVKPVLYHIGQVPKATVFSAKSELFSHVMFLFFDRKQIRPFFENLDISIYAVGWRWLYRKIKERRTSHE